MLKKILFTLCFFSSLSSVYAETCPNLTDIRIHNLRGWRALDINTGMAISEEKYAKYARSVASFALAEWAQGTLEGSSHCYYEGSKKNQSYLGVYLAKHKLKPDTSAKQWEGQGTDLQQCHGYQFECRFVRNS